MGTDLRATLDTMIGEYRGITARLGTIRAELAGLTATAHSADRCVRVTVGPSGQLVRLTIDAGRAERLDVTSLAGRILEAAGLATARAQQRVAVTISAALPEQLRQFLQPDGGLDIRRLLPDDPRDAGDPARLLGVR